MQIGGQKIVNADFSQRLSIKRMLYNRNSDTCQEITIHFSMRQKNSA